MVAASTAHWCTRAVDCFVACKFPVSISASPTLMMDCFRLRDFERLRQNDDLDPPSLAHSALGQLSGTVTFEVAAPVMCLGLFSV